MYNVRERFLEGTIVLKEEIQKLKKEKNAILLAHYYVPEDVQDIADFVGDSFALAKKAKETEADIIVFAGVRFMGESAKILNPDKKVLMPDMEADCPMAHMADVNKVKEMRETVKDLAVVCYVNSTAELKTVSDVCVTSSNAMQIVEKLPNENIYFIPDQHLASFVKAKLTNKNIILNEGYCATHHALTKEDVLKAKEQHPQALVLVHPECKSEVVQCADYAGSTAGILNYARQSDQSEFIIGTEMGVLYELKKQNPDKTFYLMSDKLVCDNMKKVTLDKVYECLDKEINEIEVDPETMTKAAGAMDRMLELTKS